MARISIAGPFAPLWSQSRECVLWRGGMVVMGIEECDLEKRGGKANVCQECLIRSIDEYVSQSR